MDITGALREKWGQYVIEPAKQVNKALPRILKTTGDIALLIGEIAFAIFNCYACKGVALLGIVIGFIKTEAMRKVVDKVNLVLNAPRHWVANTFLYACGGFAYLYLAPNSMIVAALYFSAKWTMLCVERVIPHPSPPSQLVPTHNTSSITPLIPIAS